MLPALSESDSVSTDISSGLPKVLEAGTAASSATQSAWTLLTSALAAGVFPEVMSQRSEFISLASLALGLEVPEEDERVTAFVLAVI
jgi:hypothetical protein